MKLPEISLPRRAIFTGNLNETVVETQVVSDGILPCGPALAIVGKLLYDVITYLTKSQHLVWRLGNSHRNECNVGVGRFDVILVAL